MTINTSDISMNLRPGLQGLFGIDYKTYPDQWKEIFKIFQSDKYQELDVEMKGLGVANIKPQGQPISTDTMGQRFINSYIHQMVGTSFSITKEAMQDNQYQSQFPMQGLSLRKALRIAKNILTTNVLNNGFNPAAPIGDGQSLFSRAHPIDGGTASNTFALGTDATTVALSQTGLQEAINNIQQFPMVSGVISQTMPEKLLVPRELQWEASVLLNSAFEPETGNNAINPLNYHSYLPKGFKVNQFLTSPTAWFILTDADNGLKYFQRTDVEIDTDVDKLSQTITFMASERYSAGASNWRSAWGSAGVV